MRIAPLRGEAENGQPVPQTRDSAKAGGRYWTRTSDPVRVKHVL